MSKALRVRAKRLRSAIAKVLQQEISVAQSLELVAMEENYPNWDAASANYKAPEPAIAQVTPPVTVASRGAGSESPAVGSGGGQKPISDEFKRYVASKYPNFAEDIQGMRSGLILFSGVTGSGKSTAMRLAGESLRSTGRSRLFVVNDAPSEPYEAASATTGMQYIRRMKDAVLGLDEIRTGEAARLALEMLMTGHPLMACIHARSAEDALARFQMMLTKPFFYSTSGGKAFAEEFEDSLMDQFEMLKKTMHITVFHFDTRYRMEARPRSSEALANGH